MANLQDKPPENVPGRYYVDNTCIDCDMCREIAPQIFKRQDDGAYSYVYRQPVTEEEIALAGEALVHCPTETIGNDGISLELLPTPSHPVADKLHTPSESPDDALEQMLQKTREAGADA
jgi:ferredoxin